MKHKLGMSGSTIFSEPKLYSELFIDGINHIEIGEFQDEAAVEEFLRINKEKGATFGIHSPLLRGGSKYDLLEKVRYEPNDAWDMLEKEAENMAGLGAKYILVHFPYFKEEVDFDTDEIIEEGLKKLSYIQDKYSIKLICEPKLGLNRSGVGIEYLNKFPLGIWEKYNLGLCIDIGDYIIATEDKILNYLEKWNKFICEVHLHNVIYSENEYIWTPVHPSQEQEDSSYKVKHIIEALANCNDVTFIFEHTPETNHSKEFVSEGIEWVAKLIDNTHRSHE
jgi:sugar phosphate isomerase/epimerase